MKTTDIFKTRTSQKLNETLEKTFGQKLNLETFSLEQLHDVRNKLRTHVHQYKQKSNFNETLDNEAFTKAQWMLDTVNAEIAEREDLTADVSEGFGSLEDEVQKLLNRFEENAMEIGAYGNVDVEAIVSLIAQGDAEGAADEVYGSYADQDGGEVPRLEPLIADLQDEFEALADADPDSDPEEGGDTDDAYALASAGHGSDEDYESIQYEESDFVKGVKRFIKGKKNPSDVRDAHLAKATFGDPSKKDKEEKRYDKVQNLISKESTQGEDMRKVTEGEIQQAQSIVTAKTMVDRVGRWIEELSGMENDTLLTLGDQIRDEMGQEQAKAFLTSVAPAIQAALENLKTTRETLATGVRTLTGEQQPAELIGAEPEGGDTDMAEPATPDAMNAEPAEPELGDEFAASEPAAGGAEEAGRAKRESIDRSNKLLKVLAG